VNYKTDGCPNTNSYSIDGRVYQATGSERLTPQGALIATGAA
jgi:hypothetical protein